MRTGGFLKAGRIVEILQVSTNSIRRLAMESPWNFIPREILSYIFSFLPVRNRILSSYVCQDWADAVSASSVWSFTEIRFEEDSLEMSQDMLVRILPYVKHIRSLKIMFDQSREENRKSTCDLFDMLTKQKCWLRALWVICTGISPFCYSGQDILQSIRRFCQELGTAKIQSLDVRQMPFALDNMMVGLIAISSPNLRALLINNRALGFIMVRPETISDILGICPHLSILGVPYVSLSVNVFQVMLNPSRQPFQHLQIYYNGLFPRIPDEMWRAMLRRNPRFRVGLEFTGEVHPTMLAQILNPVIPVVALRFNDFSCLVEQLTLAARNYSRTLFVLELSTAASDNLNAALIELAKRCANLREVYCYCPVSSEVKIAFLSHCPKLRRYLLSTARQLCNTPTACQ
nr:PREDICTED: F-box/LRR-repeat protein 8 [Anolis carolinensis]|eukprot:XP_008109938.1 PREDICTED: F-box/LRR-repeat protein 8 [Anolis carolinensis]